MRNTDDKDKVVKAGRALINRYAKGEGDGIIVAFRGKEYTTIEGHGMTDNAITLISALIDGVQCQCGDPECGLHGLKVAIRSAIDVYEGKEPATVN